MGHKYLHLSTFKIEGDYIGSIAKKLYLIADGKRVAVKLPKALREKFDPNLPRMTRIQVSGSLALHVKNGRVRMHADCVSPMVSDLGIIRRHNFCTSPPENTVEAKIMICQKSSCRKRGGEKLLSQVKQTLEKQGLHKRVKVQTTGCHKQCKNAPSCILKVGKKKYHKVKPKAIKQRLSLANCGYGDSLSNKID